MLASQCTNSARFWLHCLPSARQSSSLHGCVLPRLDGLAVVVRLAARAVEPCSRSTRGKTDAAVQPRDLRAVFWSML